MKAFKLLMMAGLLALAGTVSAQKSVFTASDITFNNEGKGTLEIFMNYETTETIVGWNLSLYLPEGVTIAKVYNEDDDVWEYGYTAKGDDYINSNAMANQLQIKDKEDGGYLLVCIDQKNKKEMKSTNGKIVTLPLLAASSTCSGKAEIKAAGMSNASDESVERGNIADVESTVDASQVDDILVGINDIQAADAAAPAYNLQGVRVNGSTKGLIIRDGKKMMVK